jgi:hypothetical protein
LGLNAGPGEVVLTIDLRAGSGSTAADVEIFDAEGNKVFFYYPNATTSNERSVKKFTASNKQTLTLRLALDSNVGEYAIKLGGAVELAVATPSSDASSTQNTELPQPATEPMNGATNATPAGNSSQKKPGKTNFGMNILQAVGTQFGLPTSGVLRLVMKDGTQQDIDLTQVKSASVTKP